MGVLRPMGAWGQCKASLVLRAAASTSKPFNHAAICDGQLIRTNDPRAVQPHRINSPAGHLTGPPRLSPPGRCCCQACHHAWASWVPRTSPPSEEGRSMHQARGRMRRERIDRTLHVGGRNGRLAYNPARGPGHHCGTLCLHQAHCCCPQMCCSCLCLRAATLPAV